MKINKPEIKGIDREARALSFEPPASAMAKWQPDIKAAEGDDESTINIYTVIGEDPWTGEGITPRMVSSILRKNKGKAVTVNINSPGGSFFDGNAIYNLLREHDADVNVRVVGLAASAASVIAMAGDTIKVAESGFIMIHNSWTLAMGNKDDMTECAEFLAKIDESMCAVYAKQTGMSEKEIVKMLDAETWLSGSEALAKGFATHLLDADQVAIAPDDDREYNSALRTADIAMAKAGMPRSERRKVIKELTGTPSAAAPENPMPSAGNELNEALKSLINASKP